MGVFERVGLPGPGECPGILGILVSVIGAAGSFGAIVVYDRAVWAFTLLALFALLGWVSFIWCSVWAESAPEDRIGAGVIGVVTGGIGLGVGIIAVILYSAPLWSYLIVGLSFIVAAGSLVYRWL